MQDETVAVDSIESEERYQVFVNDITWSKDTIGKFRAKYNVYEQLPRQMTFVLPDSIIAKEDNEDFYDIVETFIYNILAKRFNRVAYHCQIWLVWQNDEDTVSA